MEVNFRLANTRDCAGVSRLDSNRNHRGTAAGEALSSQRAGAAGHALVCAALPVGFAPTQSRDPNRNSVRLKRVLGWCLDMGRFAVKPVCQRTRADYGR